MTAPPYVVKAPRYEDPFLNALMFSHQAFVRGELWFAGSKVMDLAFVSGTVAADRGSTVRRRFTGTVDPRTVPLRLDDALTPYGGLIKVWRGVRYPNGQRTEYQVFSGRVESVEFGLTTVAISASDAAAGLVDARFETPYRATRGMKVVDQIKAIIHDVDATAVVTDLTGATNTISTPATWDRERTEALDNLAQTIGAEWFAGPDGVFYINRLPAITGQAAVWIVDSGDTGVAINRTTAMDRSRVYNAVVVNGEPPDGQSPAYGVARDNDPNSPTRWGGPFGKVPKFFSSQFITTNTQAQNVATEMLGDAVAGTRSVSISCVPNPRLATGDVVYVSTGAGEYDGMYFVNTFNLPLEPETPMTLGCNLALESTAEGLRPAPRLLGEGVRWP